MSADDSRAKKMKLQNLLDRFYLQRTFFANPPTTPIDPDTIRPTHPLQTDSELLQAAGFELHALPRTVISTQGCSNDAKTACLRC